MLSQFSSYFSHINFHKDLGGEQVFVSNFKPIYEEEMKDLTERVDFYELFSTPMKNHMMRSLREGGVNMCSAKPRIWNGQQTKNPRYLQVRPDVARPRDKYLAQLGSKCIPIQSLAILFDDVHIADLVSYILLSPHYQHVSTVRLIRHNQLSFLSLRSSEEGEIILPILLLMG